MKKSVIAVVVASLVILTVAVLGPKDSYTTNQRSENYKAYVNYSINEMLRVK